MKKKAPLKFTIEVTVDRNLPDEPPGPDPRVMAEALGTDVFNRFLCRKVRVSCDAEPPVVVSFTR